MDNPAKYYILAHDYELTDDGRLGNVYSCEIYDHKPTSGDISAYVKSNDYDPDEVKVLVVSDVLDIVFKGYTVKGD